MRLWTIHPKHLDRAGLVAAWREGLLARAVLEGKTRGYRKHPQLQRFREYSYGGMAAIACWLDCVYREACARGYSFDAEKLRFWPSCVRRTIPATAGQIKHERAHLLAKLDKRAPEDAARLRQIGEVEVNDVFRVVAGDKADWEKS